MASVTTASCADAAVGPEDRAVDARVGLDLAAASEHGVGADAGPGADDDALVEKRRPLDRRAVVDAHVVGLRRRGRPAWPAKGAVL